MSIRPPWNKQKRKRWGGRSPGDGHGVLAILERVYLYFSCAIVEGGRWVSRQLKGAIERGYIAGRVSSPFRWCIVSIFKC